ncbi:transcriptional regulator, TetR family [Pustulibacterium marinum]|uniref:Transcriptional regulator, TetR family n=1 Tax=Pustulibacterium marinum TaxID=1224947 RepID=A0A1I7GDK9_9FLAO|nr:TetR/AcrR family transcriptional regulator [Pustulibacterium marinum]SFU46530.1 transcriptional regulator, TetR family [Pustulibacterium marinum]
MKDQSVREHILETSKKVFQQLGYEKVTMDDVAKASGKGRSTLYYYFKNKGDVFEAVVSDEYYKMISKAKAAVNKSNSINENLLHYTEVKLKILIELATTYDRILIDIKKNEAILSKIHLNVRNEDIVLIEECLLWAIEKEEITPVSTSDIEFLALAIVTATSSIEREIFLYETIKNDMLKRLQWITQLIIKGLQH